MRCYKVAFSPSTVTQYIYIYIYIYCVTVEEFMGRGRLGAFIESSQGEIAPCREVCYKETCATIEGGGGGATGGDIANPEPHAHAHTHTNANTHKARAHTHRYTNTGNKVKSAACPIITQAAEHV
jgi:hypothetical protein